MDASNTSGHGDLTTLDHKAYYRALTAKDARFDGVFFTGVKTTGIYCRPICGVKTPRSSSCEFFSCAAAAEAAGYRPCLRCRPELAPYALQENLAHAVWQKIAAGEMNHGSSGSALEKLSTSVGLSSRQLRRVLLRYFGVGPVELAQTQRLLFAKKLLQETALPMAEIAFAAGFGSVRRFNALFVSRYGLTPSDIRRSTRVSDVAADSITLRLAYRPPYDWCGMLRYLRDRAIPGIEAVDPSTQGGIYQRSVRVGAATGWLRVAHSPDKNQLQLETASSLAPVLMPLLSRVRQQFDLDANPAVIEAHLRCDPVLANAIRERPGIRVAGAFDAFEIAVRAVLGQQISVKGATTLSGRLVSRFGEKTSTPFPSITHAFPQAALLASLSLAEIEQIGLPKARAGTIQNLARFAAQGGLHFNAGVSLAETVSRLKSIHGIGDWTAQYVALRVLRFPDAFPAGDLHLQKVMARHSKIDLASSGRLTEKQLAMHANAWAPWRGYAAFILWNS
jgi:AraC family transcriptional regulator of adaptative response / DNA-3-methyladenine glycosylase II